MQIKSFHRTVKFLGGLFLFCTYSFGFGQVNTQTQNAKVKLSQIKNFALQKGELEVQLEMDNGKYWDMHIYIPEINEGTKIPLSLALHWAGGGETFSEYANCLAVPSLKSLGGIIISPSGNYKHWVEPSNETKVIDLVKKIIKYWPVDPDKILVTGYSNGGIGSWYYARKYPKLFAAAIPIAAFYSKHKVASPVFAIHGENDELFNLKEAIAFIEQSKSNGSNIELTIAKGKSHYMACSYITELKQAVEKVKQEVFKIE